MDHGVWSALFRILLGYSVPFSWSALSTLTQGQHDSRTFVLFFLVVLMASRVIPAVLRKLLPFSWAAREAWAARRQLGKRYDSYQWQKLFWIGCGMGLYALSLPERWATLTAVVSVCLITGAAGLAVWSYRSVQIRSASAGGKRVSFAGPPQKDAMRPRAPSSLRNDF